MSTCPNCGENGRNTWVMSEPLPPPASPYPLYVTTLASTLDDLQALEAHHNLCRKEAGVGDDDVLLDRIKEMNAEIARLREALAAHAPVAGEKPV